MAVKMIMEKSKLERRDLQQVEHYRAYLICDTAADLPANASWNGIALEQGSVATVVAEGVEYMMNSAGVWKERESNFSDAIRIKGRVDSVSELPDNAKAGWLYFVGAATDPECAEYVYTEEGTWEHIGEGVPIEVDSALSTTSENPVQNKVVTSALNEFKNVPQNHNGIFRGKDLTNVYTVDEIYNRVHNGSFDDLYLGDYFTVSITTDLYTVFIGDSFAPGTTYYEKGGTYPDWTYTPTTDTTYDSSKTYYEMTTVADDVDLMIAHFNYYLDSGKSAKLTDPHLVLICKNVLSTMSRMHHENSTEGGYYNSDMNQIVLPCYAISFSAALNNHIANVEHYMTDAINTNATSCTGSGLTGTSSHSIWAKAKVILPTEPQIYGCFAMSGAPCRDGFSSVTRLALFNFITPLCWARNRSIMAQYLTVGIAGGNMYASIGKDNIITANSANKYTPIRPILVFG